MWVLSIRKGMVGGVAWRYRPSRFQPDRNLRWTLRSCEQLMGMLVSRVNNGWLRL